MHVSSSADAVEWGTSRLLVRPPTRRGRIRRPEWELISPKGRSRSNGSSDGGNSNDSGGSDLGGGNGLEERIARMLDQWEGKSSGVILKWGSMGVKSTEYIRVQRHMAMERRRMEEERREMRKRERDQKNEIIRKKKQDRMAASAWVRRRCRISAEVVGQSAVPPKKPCSPSSFRPRAQSVTPMTACSSFVRHKHVSLAHQPDRTSSQYPLTGASTNVPPEKPPVTEISGISVIEDLHTGPKRVSPIDLQISSTTCYTSPESVSVIKEVTTAESNHKPTQFDSEDTLTPEVQYTTPPIPISEALQNEGICEEGSSISASSEETAPVALTSSVHEERKLQLVGGLENGSFVLSGIVVNEAVPSHESTSSNKIISKLENKTKSSFTSTSSHSTSSDSLSTNKSSGMPSPGNSADGQHGAVAGAEDLTQSREKQSGSTEDIIYESDFESVRESSLSKGGEMQSDQIDSDLSRDGGEESEVVVSALSEQLVLKARTESNTDLSYQDDFDSVSAMTTSEL